MLKMGRQWATLVLLGNLLSVFCSQSYAGLVFVNPSPIIVPSSGQADIYPAPINVSGVVGRLENIRIALNGAAMCGSRIWIGCLTIAALANSRSMGGSRAAPFSLEPKSMTTSSPRPDREAKWSTPTRHRGLSTSSRG